MYLVLFSSVALAQSQLPTCRGTDTSTWNACKGEETQPNGQKYIGEFKNGKYHGQGTFTFPNGQKYVGEFKYDKSNGQGTFTFPNGQKYIGGFKNGKYHGQGNLTFPDGEKYIGEFKDGKYHGQGTLTFPSGEKHAGEFKDDKANGQGTHTLPDGRRYVGEVKDGKYHGQGTQTTPNGQKYVGEFKDGKYQGQGTQKLADGRKYAGERKDDKEFKDTDLDKNKTQVSSHPPKISDEEKIDTCIEQKFEQEKKNNLSITRVKIDKWRIECETDIQFSLMPAITVESKPPEKETAKIDRALENKNGLIQGIESHKKGNYQQAFQILKPLAEEGNARAQAYVGMMYLLGDGTSQSYAEALRLAKLSVKQGDPEGQLLLSFFYEVGEGVNKNPKEAFRLCALSAQQGNRDGQMCLANMYEEGRGVPQNLSEAIKFYKLAADKGDAVAKKKVSELTAKSAASRVDFKVTATAIINEFKSNKLAAGLKYKDKTALIEGVVNEIEPTRFIKPESVQIRMRDSNDSLDSVRVILNATPEQLSLATRLSKGDYITASCKNIEGGSLSGVLAKNCSLVPQSAGGPVDLIDAVITTMQFGTPDRASIEAKYIGKRVQANMFITTYAERSGSRRLIDGNSPFFCDVFPADIPKFPTKKGGFVVEGTFVVENGVPGLTRCKYIRDQ